MGENLAFFSTDEIRNFYLQISTESESYVKIKALVSSIWL